MKINSHIPDLGRGIMVMVWAELGRRVGQVVLYNKVFFNRQVHILYCTPIVNMHIYISQSPSHTGSGWPMEIQFKL